VRTQRGQSTNLDRIGFIPLTPLWRPLTARFAARERADQARRRDSLEPRGTKNGASSKYSGSRPQTLSGDPNQPDEWRLVRSYLTCPHRLFAQGVPRFAWFARGQSEDASLTSRAGPRGSQAIPFLRAKEIYRSGWSDRERFGESPWV
jgi:hypothetical protein